MQAMLDAAVDLLEFDGGLLYLHTDPDNVAELRAWRRAPEVLVKQGGRVPITLPNLAPVYRGESWFADAYPDSAQYRGAMAGRQGNSDRTATAGRLCRRSLRDLEHEPTSFRAAGASALRGDRTRGAGMVIARMQAEEQSHAPPSMHEASSKQALTPSSPSVQRVKSRTSMRLRRVRPAFLGSS